MIFVPNGRAWPHGDSHCEIHTCRTSLVVARLIYCRAATLDNCHSRRSEPAPRESVISAHARHDRGPRSRANRPPEMNKSIVDLEEGMRSFSENEQNLREIERGRRPSAERSIDRLEKQQCTIDGEAA
jgi:hypothetical protein